MDLENNENEENQSKVKIPHWLNKPTTLSKILTMILFIGLPVGAFYFGINYQKKITGNNYINKMDLSQEKKKNDEGQNLPTSNPIVLPPTSTPTTNLTADWKIYTNSKLGFSFKYDSKKL